MAEPAEAIRQACPQLVKADMRALTSGSGFDPTLDIAAAQRLRRKKRQFVMAITPPNSP